MCVPSLIDIYRASFDLFHCNLKLHTKLIKANNSACEFKQIDTIKPLRKGHFGANKHKCNHLVPCTEVILTGIKFGGLDLYCRERELINSVPEFPW